MVSQLPAMASYTLLLYINPLMSSGDGGGDSCPESGDGANNNPPVPGTVRVRS